MSLEQVVKEEVGKLKVECQRQIDAWGSGIEASVNTARPTGTVEDSGALKNAIPEHLRGHCEIAERLGLPHPVRRVAEGAYFQALISGMLAPMRGESAQKWYEQRLAIERAWRYDADAYRALVKATIGEGAGGGGNIIATPVEAELRRLIRDNSVIRPLATVIAMSGPTHQLPTENANLTGFVIAESGLVSDAYGNNTTGFASVPLTARKFGALVTITNELLNDNIIGLRDYLFTAISEAIGILEDQAAIEGAAAGVNFTGLETVSGVNSFTGAGNTSGGDSPSYPDLVKAIYLGTHRSSRMNGQWVMSPKVFRQVAALIDTNGQPIFQYANVPNGIPERILGYPVHVSGAITKTSSIKSGSLSAWFGPMNRIVFGDLAGLEFALDPYSRFANYETRLRVLRRTGITVPVGAFYSVIRGCSIT